jgi:hypothetical protein
VATLVTGNSPTTGVATDKTNGHLPISVVSRNPFGPLSSPENYAGFAADEDFKMKNLDLGDWQLEDYRRQVSMHPLGLPPVSYTATNGKEHKADR